MMDYRRLTPNFAPTLRPMASRKKARPFLHLSTTPAILRCRSCEPKSTRRSNERELLGADLRLSGTCPASRADDAGLVMKRIGDPRDVEHLRGRANGRIRCGRDEAVAAAHAAGFGNRGHDVFAVEA